MKKTKVKMNKLVSLGLSILEISKTLIYESQYDFVKPKYQQHEKLCDKDTDSLIIYINIEDKYKNITNYEINRSLPPGKNQKVIGLLKYELGGKLTTEFVAL